MFLTIIIFHDSDLLIISAPEVKKKICLHKDCKFPPNRKSLTKRTLMMDVSFLFTPGLLIIFMIKIN